MTRDTRIYAELVRAIAGSLAAVALACGGDAATTAPPNENPVPTITAVSPAQAMSGQPQFTLTVEGAHFIASSVVRWNGLDRSTTYVDGGTLEALVPASDVAAAGTASITVYNPPPGGGVSGSLSVSVVNPVPSLTALSPDTVITGQDGFTLTVTGANFVAASVVQWNGLDRSTTYVDSGTVRALVPASDVAAAGTASITVFNPPPGGGVSSSGGVSVVNPAPSLTTLAPDTVITGQDGFTLTVSGANFVAASVVQWNGSDRPTTYVSGGTLRAAITLSDAATAGSASVTVFTPPPGGGTSDPLAVPVVTLAPSITALSQVVAFAGQAAFTLTVAGANFTTASLLRWNGADRPTSYVNGGVLQAAIAAGDVATADTAAITVFTPPPGGGTSESVVFPIVSGPTGQIAFVSNRDGNREIYVMNADGTQQTNLTNNPARDIAPAWSPDGSKIAFASDRDGNWEIYVMNADGTGLANLTNSPAEDWRTRALSWDEAPAWSPDGSRILFPSDRDGNWEVYSMNADGTGEMNLTNRPDDPDYYGSWSPDGSKILWETSTGLAVQDLYTMNADGTDQVNLTNAPNTGNSRAAWSPDGSRIAFVHVPSGSAGEVYVMNADGTSPVDVTNSAADDYGPKWSPDGAWIAFLVHEQQGWALKRIAADGTNAAYLSTNSSPTQYAWSHDGAWIAFYRDAQGGGDIWLTDASGTLEVNLTNLAGVDVKPAWRPTP